MPSNCLNKFYDEKSWLSRQKQQFPSGILTACRNDSVRSILMSNFLHPWYLSLKLSGNHCSGSEFLTKQDGTKNIQTQIPCRRKARGKLTFLSYVILISELTSKYPASGHPASQTRSAEYIKYRIATCMRYNFS